MAMVMRLLAMVTAVLLPEISMILSLSGSGLRSRDLCPPLEPTSMMLMLAPLSVLISLILAPLFPITAPITSLGTFISYLLVSLSLLSSLQMLPDGDCLLDQVVDVLG